MRQFIARYQRRILAMMAVYVATFFGVAWVFRYHHITGPIGIVLASLPALPILGVVVIAALYMREEKDEVQKAMRMQAMLWGIGLTLIVATLWGFLESFGQVPHVDSYMAFPLFCVCTGAAGFVVWRRYL